MILKTPYFVRKREDVLEIFGKTAYFDIDDNT